MNSGNLIAGAMETMAVFTLRAPPGGALPGLELVGVARGGQEVDNRLTVRRWSVYLGFISLAMMVIRFLFLVFFLGSLFEFETGILVVVEFGLGLPNLVLSFSWFGSSSGEGSGSVVCSF
ncbi:hypothetical protein REPUB_Repub20aG0138700 [Reevesia pubescens]